MLLVFDNPEDDLLMIQTSASDTRMACYFMLATFRRRDIIELILRSRETLNVNSLFMALIGFVHTSKLRLCPTCNAGPAAGCVRFSRLAPRPSPGQFV